MTEQEIIAGNKLIAEFIGADLHQRSLLYHKSWDLLDPVVEKINELPWTSFIPTENVGASEIESVFKLVVKFIEWYNYITPKPNNHD